MLQTSNVFDHFDAAIARKKQPVAIPQIRVHIEQGAGSENKNNEEESVCMNMKPRPGKNRKRLQDHPALYLGRHRNPGFRATKLFFIEEVHHRAETITPLLKEILEFRPPPHWN